MSVNKHSGFTLIELIITVLIVSIMGAVAVPAYQEYILSARTAEAYQIISTMMTHQKSYFLNNQRFCSTSWIGGMGTTWSRDANDPWNMLGLPVGENSTTMFKYFTIGGNATAQRGGCSATDYYGTITGTLQPFDTDYVSPEYSTNADNCTGVGRPIPATTGNGTGGGSAGRFFRSNIFGVSAPSSGSYDWAVFLAQGYLFPGTQKCRYVGAALEVAPTRGSKLPTLIGGFIQFDYDYATKGSSLDVGPVDEEPIEETPISGG